jgi:serine/threonine-protein kinase
VSSPSSGRATRLLKGTFATYVHTGHLVFLRGGVLMAAPVSLRSVPSVGTPDVAIEGVGARPFSGTGWYALARSGTLIYAAALGSTDHALVWVDRLGRALPATPDQRAYATPRVAPDGARLTVTVYAPDGTPDLWMYEIERGSMVRLTSDGLNTGASWSPDGSLIAFTSRRAGDLFFAPWVMSGDGRNPRRLRASDYPGWATSWSADGQRLAVTELHPSTGMDIVSVRLDGGDPTEIVKTGSSEANGVFSPNGRWIAYMSNQTGRSEIHLRTVGGTDRGWPVSVEGGSEPVWSRRGDELFYRQGTRVMAVTVGRGDGDQPRIGVPGMLFEGLFEQDASSGPANFDVGFPPRDFLMVQSVGRRTPRMTIVLDWLNEVRRLAPSR